MREKNCCEIIVDRRLQPCLIIYDKIEVTGCKETNLTTTHPKIFWWNTRKFPKSRNTLLLS